MWMWSKCVERVGANIESRLDVRLLKHRRMTPNFCDMEP
jgi:hypothetical protein